jgi:hypothetical protein
VVGLDDEAPFEIVSSATTWSDVEESAILAVELSCLEGVVAAQAKVGNRLKSTTQICSELYVEVVALEIELFYADIVGCFPQLKLMHVDMRKGAANCVSFVSAHRVRWRAAA